MMWSADLSPKFGEWFPLLMFVSFQTKSILFERSRNYILISSLLAPKIDSFIKNITDLVIKNGFLYARIYVDQ